MNLKNLFPLKNIKNIPSLEILRDILGLNFRIYFKLVCGYVTLTSPYLFPFTTIFLL